jgi:F-type H+-transporting ATPase subunit delta
VEQQARHETVFDTGAEHLGQVYAEALLAATAKAGVADLAVDQLSQIVDSLYEHPDLAVVFGSPRISVVEKGRILDRLFGGQINPMLMQFLKVTAERGRLGYLKNIATSAQAQRDETLGRTVAEVTSAVPLDDQARQQVVQRLAMVHQREIVLREKVNPALLGGLVIRIGDTVYDSSVAGRLDGMAKRTRQSFARKLMENSSRFASGSIDQ